MHLTKCALIAATALTFGGCASVMAQTSDPASTAAPATQAAEAAHPNITGIWEIWPDPFAGDENTFLELPVPGDGPKLREPYATEWKTLREERDALLRAGTPRVDPSTQCTPEGMPSIMGAIFPLEILQTPGRVTVLGEFLTQTRRIYLDKPMPPAEELNPNFYGFSTGHWEGDTLVVTTKGVKEDTEFFEIPHTTNMVITERIRLTGPDLLENEITIEDPERLLEPYTFTYGYRRNPDYVIQEYFCEPEDPLLKFNEDGTVEMKTGEDF
ncbi:hypothetical protein D2V17_14830 [Aurantiacibacter xanthus]|uniref:Lipoprotein n=1 Tax=Aurantiacibacter xanthus TaxID=1784712 RepID=A0A3A1P5I4_9SPHN|nr:hypothetical protein [Aurantiacibacter xanthus]RIV82589.1 hypothetical protein D2V17_14830 [Aurantiacibacter xanthus]